MVDHESVKRPESVGGGGDQPVGNVRVTEVGVEVGEAVSFSSERSEHARHPLGSAPHGSAS